MRRLHRLLDHCHQLLTHLAQVDFMAQCGTERLQRFGSVILATVEATVNELLDPPAEWLKQGSNGKGGTDNRHTVCLTDEAAQEELQPNDEAEVDQSEQGGHSAIDQCPVDEEVNVVQPRSQNGDGEREGTEQQAKRIAHDVE